jgi:dienelactone hydrolase
MRERAYRFGRSQHLMGIAGLPDETTGKTGVIVLNAGLVYRIGPFRLHVDLTRHLNARGYPTLRMDLSTIGDSSATDEAQSREQQVRADLSDAMALLGEQSGCTRFVLIGLCSGAANAHLAAGSDERVAGAVFLDGYAYRTLGFKLRYYLPRLLQPARVGRFLARRIHKSKSKPQQSAAAGFAVEFPSRQQAREDIMGMLDRGLKLNYIYSGGASGYFNHRRQFRECFGRAVGTHPGVEVNLFEETDHTYILAGDRTRLLETIGTWFVRRFPVAGADAGN